MTRCELPLDVALYANHQNGTAPPTCMPDIHSSSIPAEVSPEPCQNIIAQQSINDTFSNCVDQTHTSIDSKSSNTTKTKPTTVSCDAETVSLHEPQKICNHLLYRRETEPELPLFPIHTHHCDAPSKDSNNYTMLSSPKQPPLNLSMKKPYALTTSSVPSTPTTTTAVPRLADFVDHPEDEDSRELARDLVSALRIVGDNLDQKMDRKTKISLMQSFITPTASDLSGLKAVFLIVTRLWTEYNRL